jgi:hypothetical protein
MRAHCVSSRQAVLEEMNAEERLRMALELISKVSLATGSTSTHRLARAADHWLTDSTAVPAALAVLIDPWLYSVQRNLGLPGCERGAERLERSLRRAIPRAATVDGLCPACAAQRWFRARAGVATTRLRSPPSDDATLRSGRALQRAHFYSGCALLHCCCRCVCARVQERELSRLQKDIQRQVEEKMTKQQVSRDHNCHLVSALPASLHTG